MLLLGVILVIMHSVSYGHQENSYFLYGEIGDIQVGMFLDEFENVCNANYIYKTTKKEKFLRGNIDEDSSYVLNGFTWDTAKSTQYISETLILKQRTDHFWEGKWFSGDSIVKKVVLKPIHIDSLNHPYIEVIKKYNVDAYFAYATSDIVFKEYKTQKLAAGMKVIWYSEPETGIELFRLLENEKSLPDLKNINESLTYEHLKLVYTSISGASLDIPKNYRVHCNVNFLNSNYVSYTITTAYDFNEQYEDTHTDYYTLSVETAKKSMLEDIIWFGQKPKPEFHAGEAKWFTYRYEVFGEKVLQILTTIYRKKMLETEVCNYSDPGNWQFPNWYLTKKGLSLGLVPRTGNTGCKTPSWFVIPWDYLKEYIVIL